MFEPSGDDALGALAAGAGSVLQVAPDAPAAALAHLKRVAARELPIQSVRSLLGYGHFGRRIWFYHFLRGHLPNEAQAIFDAHEASVREGLAGGGELERAMAAFRRRAAPLAGGPPQGALGVRWRAAAALALPALARLAGAPAEGALARLEAAVARGGAPVDWLFTGAWRDPDTGHPWLSTSGFSALKPRIAALSVEIAPRADVLARGGWTVAVLGRRPLDPAEADALARGAAAGGRVLGWATRAAPTLRGPLRVDVAAGEHLARVDAGLFPGVPWLARG